MKMRWKCSLILDENTAQIQYLVALDFFSLHFAQFQVLIPSPSLFCIVALFSAARKFSAEFNGLSWLSAQEISVVRIHTTFCIILCQMQNRNKSLFAHQLLFERRGGGNYYANRQDQGYYIVYQYIHYIHVENPRECRLKNGKAQCLKILQNVAIWIFQFWHFSPIFVLKKWPVW